MQTLLESLMKTAAVAVAGAKEFAPGIPADKRKSPIPRVPRFGPPTTYIYTAQGHEAVKSGLHTDLRLSDGSKAYSWAVRKGIPMIPGEKVLAVRQPDHSHAYASFEGQLTSGYGRTKGRGVWIEEQGPARIVYADEEKIRFTLVSAQNPRQYTMIRQGGDSWLLINTTPTPASRPNVPQSKPKYKEADPSEFDKYLTDGSRTAVTAKLDGGHVTLNFDKESPEVYSYRPSERQTGLLDHTFLMGLEKTRTPNSLRGIRVRGDLYAVDKDGKAVPNRIVSGLMNSSPQVGRDKALAEDLKLRIGIHDVVTGPKGKPMESAPWGDKLEILKKVVQKLKDDRLHLPQMAVTPEAQKKLFESIRDKTNKTTDEGVVVWRMDQAGAPIKIKFRDHRQVYFHTAYQGSGSLNGTLGSFSYSLTPSGPEVGTVGTGFDDAEREWIWKSRNTLKGRKVVIKSDEQFPSGAYRAPSYDHFHD